MEILAQLIIALAAIGVAFWAIYWGYQQKRLQYQERQQMIERGMMPPLEMPGNLMDGFFRHAPEDYLRRGIKHLFVGMGFAVVYFVLGNTAPDQELVWFFGVAGALAGFLGLGNLVYYFVAVKRKPDDVTQK